MQRVTMFFALFVLGLSLLATSGCEEKLADKKPGDKSSGAAAISMSPAKAATKDTASAAAPTEATASPATPPVAAEPAAAGVISGEAGSPSATTTISGKQLPRPDPAFGGVVKENAAQSKPWWPPRVVPPKARPMSCSS